MSTYCASSLAEGEDAGPIQFWREWWQAQKQSGKFAGMLEVAAPARYHK